MKQFSSSDIRNFAIVGHGGSGKTLTGGRGIHSESFSHYEKMPKEFEQKVIQQRKKTEDE